MVNFDSDRNLKLRAKRIWIIEHGGIFIDQLAVRSSNESYLTCGAGILQLIVFDFKQPFGVIFKLYKVSTRALY